MVAIQIRDVSDEVRDALAMEAESRGQSLQVFLLQVLDHEAKMARNRAWMKRVRDTPPAAVESDLSTADLIRRQREERTEHILEAAFGDER